MAVLGCPRHPRGPVWPLGSWNILAPKRIPEGRALVGESRMRTEESYGRCSEVVLVPSAEPLPSGNTEKVPPLP